MKRWFWLMCAAVVMLFFGEAGKNLEELKPVQLVYVQQSSNHVIVQTDTGDLGTGADFNDAVENMQSSASGTIFLETAEQLVLTEDAVGSLPQIYEKLRPAAVVCLSVGEIEPKGAAEFLSAHKPKITLQQLRSGKESLAVLKGKEGRYELVEGEDNAKAAADLGHSSTDGTGGPYSLRHELGFCFDSGASGSRNSGGI